MYGDFHEAALLQRQLADVQAGEGRGQRCARLRSAGLIGPGRDRDDQRLSGDDEPGVGELIRVNEGLYVVPYFSAMPKSVSSACTICRRLAIDASLARGVTVSPWPAVLPLE